MFLVCPSGNYGIHCKPCGQCSGNDVCNDENGQCPHGCKTHWNGTKCDGKKKICSLWPYSENVSVVENQTFTLHVEKSRQNVLKHGFISLLPD